MVETKDYYSVSAVPSYGSEARYHLRYLAPVCPTHTSLTVMGMKMYVEDPFVRRSSAKDFLHGPGKSIRADPRSDCSVVQVLGIWNRMIAVEEH